MIEIKPMDESYILVTCLHHGPVDSTIWAPTGDDGVAELPPHPWSDETIRELAARHDMISHGGDGGGPQREFMREMIRRYGTCAILAWDEHEVIGLIRFYPMVVARLIAATHTHGFSPVLDCTAACEPPDDERTLWVQCVMTCVPYVDSEEAKKAGARKGLGLRLAHELVCWARKSGWERVVKVAHCDLDWFYGIQGGGGWAFWRKAGFEVAGTLYQPLKLSKEHGAIVHSQMVQAGMTDEDVCTWYRMRYEL